MCLIKKKRDSIFISVIMNCYNSEKYLHEAIDSVISQTYQNWEIIFWDNRSSDSSAEIFKSYNDERLHYLLAPEHTELGKARNLAVSHANGEWLGFLDCDDTWLKSKLHNQVGIIEKDQNLGLVYGGAKIVINGKVSSDWAKMITKNKNKKKAFMPDGYVFDNLLFNNFIYLSSAMVRRDVFYEVGKINDNYKQAEDLDLFLKISSKYRVGVFKDIVVNYRVHENNLSSYQKDLDYKESIDIISKYKKNKSAEKAIAFNQIIEVYFHLKNNRMRAGFNIFKKINKIQLLLTTNMMLSTIIKKVIN